MLHLQLHFITCIIVLSYNLINGEPEICRTGSGYCNAESSNVLFQVKCECFKRKDIFHDLSKLESVTCPYVPNYADSDIINNTRLIIKNCDIIVQEFPKKLLQVLRRSKKLEISIRDATTLRLPSDVSAENSETVIDATISNSHISGIGAGWFSGSKGLTLKIYNSSVDIFDSKAISSFHKDAKVDVLLEATNIQTIKMFAISLPTKASFAMKGGRIAQIERRSFEGGSSINLEGLTIGSIQKEAFNVLNIQSFSINSCMIAKTEKRILVSNHLKDREYNDMKNDKVGAISIKGNKFIKMHKETFIGLCNEESLNFEDNIIQEISLVGYTFLVPDLEMQNCKHKRDWQSSVRNNGFNCEVVSNPCNSFADNMEQNCIFFRTSWCLCKYDSSSATVSGTQSNSPCKQPVEKFLESKCTKEMVTRLSDNCPLVSDVDWSLTGRSFYHISNGSSFLWASLGHVIMAMLVLRAVERILLA